jgi:hypothetical protein
MRSRRHLVGEALRIGNAGAVAKTVKAARIMVFIGILHLQSGEM